jgi:hypothetical protein
MTKRILIDQVSAHDLQLSELMPILSQAGFNCCCTALAFEKPAEMETCKRLFSEGGNDLTELFFDENGHKTLRSIYCDYRETRGISYYDAAILVMAATQNCCILGSDPPLCKLAADMGVEVISYNKLLGLMVKSNNMTLEDAFYMAFTIYYGHNPAAIIENTEGVLKIPALFGSARKSDLSNIA